mmetsp:Transcript_8524/g.16512  ORF Transcript_8524/g.16512 Transcript_8524/m.16512 type:complete len:178 (+) Transcript_8524:41-574(+)
MDTISVKVSDGGKDYRPLFHCKPDNRLYDTVRSYLRNQFPDLKDVPFELGYTDYDKKFTVIRNSQELVEAHKRHQTQSPPPVSLLALNAKRLSTGESHSANASLGLLHDDALPFLNELESNDHHFPPSIEVPDQQVTHRRLVTTPMIVALVMRRRHSNTAQTDTCAQRPCTFVCIYA